MNEPSPREAALQALEVALKSVFTSGTVRRNEALSESIDDLGHVVLLDGVGTNEPLVGSHTPIYSWQWVADVVTAVQHSDPTTRSLRLHNALDKISTFLVGSPYPVAGVRATIVSSEIDQAFQPANGVVPISVATLGVLLEYSTTNPTG